MRSKLKNMDQVKKYKLYKAKSQWVIATVAFVSLGLGALTTTAQAEDTASVESTTNESTTQDQSSQSKGATLRAGSSATQEAASQIPASAQQENQTTATSKQTQSQQSTVESQQSQQRAVKPQQSQQKSTVQASVTSPQTKKPAVTDTAGTVATGTVPTFNKGSQAPTDVQSPTSIDTTNIKYDTKTNTATVNGAISATELQRLRESLSSVTNSTGIAANINQVADVPNVSDYKVQINGKDSDTLNVDQLKNTDVQQITVSGNFNPNDNLTLEIPKGYGITQITGDNNNNFTGDAGITADTGDYYYTYTAKDKVQGNLNFYFSMDIPSYINSAPYSGAAFNDSLYASGKAYISKLATGNQTDPLPISISLNGTQLNDPTITLNKTPVIKGLYYQDYDNSSSGFYTQNGQLISNSVDYYHSVIPSTNSVYFPTFNASDTLSADYQYTINFDGNTTLTALPTVRDGATYLINNADAASYKLGQDPVNTIEVTVKKGTYDLNGDLFTNGLSEVLSAAGINKLKAATDGTIDVKKTVTPTNPLEVNNTAVVINPNNVAQTLTTAFNVAKYGYFLSTGGYTPLSTAEQINQAPNGALINEAYLDNDSTLALPADGLDYTFDLANKGDGNTVYTGLVVTNVKGDMPSKLTIVRSDGTTQDISATSYASNNNASWYQFDEPIKAGDKIVITGTNTHNPTLGSFNFVVTTQLYGKSNGSPAPDAVAKFVTNLDYKVQASGGDVISQSTAPREEVAYSGIANDDSSGVVTNGFGSDAVIKQLDQGITLNTRTSTLDNVIPAGQDIKSDINTLQYGLSGNGTSGKSAYISIISGTNDSVAKHVAEQPLTGYLALSNNISVKTSALTGLLGVSANNIHVYQDTNNPNLNIVKIDDVNPNAIDNLSNVIVTNPGKLGMASNVLQPNTDYNYIGLDYTVSPTALPNTTISIPKSIYLTTNKVAINATDSSYFDQNIGANATFITSKVAAPTVYSQETSIQGSGDSSATDAGLIDTAKSRTATVTQVLYNGGNTPINTVSANIDLTDANTGVLLSGAPTITSIADNSTVPADVTYQDINGNNTTDIAKAAKATITIGTTATNATTTLVHGAGYQIKYQLTVPIDAQMDHSQEYAVKLNTTNLDTANTPLANNLKLRVAQTATQTIRVKEMLADTLPTDVKTMTTQVTGFVGDSITPDYDTLTQAINNLGNYNILGLFDGQGNKVTSTTLAATNPDLYVEVQNQAVKQVTTNVNIPSNKGPQTVSNVTGITGHTVNVTVPDLPGYTKDKTTVPATVNPDDTITVNTPDTATGDTGYVTYTANSQKINVQFVDQNGNKLGKTITLTGASDSNVDLTPAIQAEQDLINTGYTPSKGNNNGLDSITKTFVDYGKIPTYIVELSRVRGVEVDKVPTDNVPFANKYTINFVTPDGNIIGTTTIVGNPGDQHDLTPNLPEGYVPTPSKTGNITVTKGQDPETPIIFNVTTPAGQDSDGIQTWAQEQVPNPSPHANQYTVNFVTPNGKIIGTTTIVGNPGDQHDLTPDLPNGYVPTPGKTGNITVTKGQDPETPIIFNVTTPAGQDSDGIQTWAQEQVPNSSPHANQYTVNFVTPGGTVVGTTTVVGNPGNQIIITGNVPNGYTLAGGDGRVEISNDQTPSQPINVNVVSNGSSSGGETAPATPISTDTQGGTPIGTETNPKDMHNTGANGDSMSNTIANGSSIGNNVANDGIMNNNSANGGKHGKNTVATDRNYDTGNQLTDLNIRNNNAKPEFVHQSSQAQAGQFNSQESKLNVAKSKTTVLPQTNEQSTSVWAMIGLGLMSILSLFTFTKRNKHEDNN